MCGTHNLGEVLTVKRANGDRCRHGHFGAILIDLVPTVTGESLRKGTEREREKDPASEQRLHANTYIYHTSAAARGYIAR